MDRRYNYSESKAHVRASREKKGSSQESMRQRSEFGVKECDGQAHVNAETDTDAGTRAGT